MKTNLLVNMAFTICMLVQLRMSTAQTPFPNRAISAREQTLLSHIVELIESEETSRQPGPSQKQHSEKKLDDYLTQYIDLHKRNSRREKQMSREQAETEQVQNQNRDSQVFSETQISTEESAARNTLENSNKGAEISELEKLFDFQLLRSETNSEKSVPSAPNVLEQIAEGKIGDEVHVDLVEAAPSAKKSVLHIGPIVDLSRFFDVDEEKLFKAGSADSFDNRHPGIILFRDDLTDVDRMKQKKPGQTRSESVQFANPIFGEEKSIVQKLREKNMNHYQNRESRITEKREQISRKRNAHPDNDYNGKIMYFVRRSEKKNLGKIIQRIKRKITHQLKRLRLRQNKFYPKNIHIFRKLRKYLKSILKHTRHCVKKSSIQNSFVKLMNARFTMCLRIFSEKKCESQIKKHIKHTQKNIVFGIFRKLWNDSTKSSQVPKLLVKKQNNLHLIFDIGNIF